MRDAPEAIVVRPAAAADLDAIAAIQAAAIQVLGAATYAPDQLEAWARSGFELRHGLLDQGSFFLAEMAGRPVGVAGWSPDARDRSAAWIRYVFVRPEVARRGVGRRLMTTVEGSARESGRSVLHVWSSLNALAFYGALGYRRRRGVRIPLGSGMEMSCLHMVKPGAPRRPAAPGRPGL